MTTFVDSVPTLKQLWEKRCSQTPHKTFVIQDDKNYTYKDIDNLVEHRVKDLTRNHIRSGMIVAVQMNVHIQCIAFILACVKLNVIIMPLYQHLDKDETKKLINKVHPNLLISKVGGNTSLSDISMYLKGYYTELDSNFLYYKKLNQNNVKFQDNFKPNSPALILCTSGTTNSPKAVLLTNYNILYSEVNFVKTYQINSTDIILIPSGFHHAMSFHHGLISTIIAGGSLVLMDSYNVTKLKDMINKYKCTWLATVPTVIFDLLNMDDVGSLKRIISGGDLLSRSLLVKAKEKNIPVYNVYGLTEAVPFLCTSPSYFKEHNCLTNTGYPITGVRTKLISKDNKEIDGPEKEGQIIVNGPVVFSEYYNDPQKTADAFFKGRWFKTGDWGYYLPDGSLKVTGRDTNRIIRGGENIPASVVKSYLESIPVIKEAFVCGITDQRLGEKIGAYVVLKDRYKSLSLKQVLSYFSRKKIDRKYWPEIINVVDHIPKTSTGKVRINLLADLSEDRGVKPDGYK